ncbi:asparagine synthase (glutamine-hydrolyzing) [Ahniella affigens]|uniref:asparagine synthase (glutamine-hydrolyzing) n=1 Tax=Ahniella affigens TaxID=2021234 RepID=A0A2P1PYH0_9GAMM|nr:asparagine synthase (glutamine-hydrolyzing) [Ahniella affigens]AVP99889.1 asparagine synthase (glutamine-hydrolyzing) [Ahniella affigens]
MCGLVAIYAYQHAALPVEREELRRIRDHMRLRGPDGHGEWLSADGRIGMGHRRLAIIDLDPRAAQPMTRANDRYVIVFNGEIYNYRSLRTELGRLGHEFRTQSDTEVILAAYQQYGSQMFAHLRGMYALAIFDQVEQRLLLGRDPFGIKPLYYADDGWTIRVASQVKALLAGGTISSAHEPAGLVGFLLTGSVPEPFTTHAGIRAVPAGSYVEVDAFGIRRIAMHSHLASLLHHTAPETLPRGALQERLRAAFADSVGAHLVADVPVGVFLSGGIDSAAVLALMREQSPNEIRSSTIVFEPFRGSELDESALAQSSADAYGATHTLRSVSNTELRDDLGALLAAMDQPSIDGINTWFAAKSCREQGLKVVNNGLGGDELLGGYPSFSTVPRWRRLAALPAALPGLGQLVRRISYPMLKQWRPHLIRAAGALELVDSLAGSYLLRRGLFMPFEIAGLIGPELTAAGLERLDIRQRLSASIQPDPGSDFARVTCLEASNYMRNQLLRDCDWASMAHSIEVRTPLVDWTLYQSLAGLIRSGNLARGKQLLAHAPRQPLPAAVVQRRKTGFAAPLTHSPWDSTVRIDVGESRFGVGMQSSPARNLAAYVWTAQGLPT